MTSRDAVAPLAPIAASTSLSLIAEKAAQFLSASTRPGFSKPAAIAVAINPSNRLP